MRAVCLHEQGGLGSLTLEENFPDPVAGEGQVLLRVKATSLNYHDVFTCRGMPGIKVPMPMIIGLDVAGEIAELGAGVEGWSVGDPVLVNPLDPLEPQKGLMGEMLHGGTAELCAVDAPRLIAMPDGVSFEQAAALPVAYGTAHRMLFTHGKLKAGEKILILGASVMSSVAFLGEAGFTYDGQMSPYLLFPGNSASGYHLWRIAFWTALKAQ